MSTPFFRTIPILLVDDGELVKTVKFKKGQYIGDPINAMKIFNEKEVDELVILDIGASKNKTDPDFALIEQLASEAFMPVAYGGGITNFEHAKKLFALGIEKVIINSEFLVRPDFIKEIASVFGVQSVVVSIDYKYSLFGKRKVYSHKQKKTLSKYTVEELIQLAANIGVAEIVLNSVSHDGMMQGMDIDFLKQLKGFKVNIIPIGGVGCFKDILAVKENANVKACGVGSKFVYQDKSRSVMINYLKPNEKNILE
ncbi:HisA/HisF-related TIM barrel protein [Pseudoalteromonas sp.]|uniref:HisA/HisF-related TIM barrel protein n=1 Tax=Pseudoalteromonas sp. TaxID=53249 RepID=UPI00260F0867|nr:HisA/HisF-related TIM barrel protein [Pseudoalteromonas sp.]MCP4588114.1 imidazole glycerol phosphate synthase subunit HisF [Pseudoalteromonas sp.]